MSIYRPTEDEAIENVEYYSKLKKIYEMGMKKWELKICEKENSIIKEMGYMLNSTHDIHKIIQKETGKHPKKIKYALKKYELYLKYEMHHYN